MVKGKLYTLCLGRQLHSQLKQQAKLDSRHLSEQVLYLLEVMLSVAKQSNHFRIKPEMVEPTERNLSVKLDFQEGLDLTTFSLAGDYGLTQQQLIRTLLWMGLELAEQVCPKGQALRKEEFAGLVMEKLRQPALIQ